MGFLFIGIAFLIIGFAIRIVFPIPCTNCMDLEWLTLPAIGSGGEFYVLGFTSTGLWIVGGILTIARLFGSKRRR